MHSTHAVHTIQRAGIAGLAALVVAALFQNVIGHQTGEEGGLGEMAFVLVVNLLIAAWLFLRVIPRAIEAGPATAAKRALVMGALGALFIFVFWAGLPFILGPAAIALGVEARRRDAGTPATVATVLGVVAVVGAAAFTAGDYLDVI